MGRELEQKRYTNGQQVYEKMLDIIQHQENTKKDLNDPDNQDSVITHLEPDILESEV